MAFTIFHHRMEKEIHQKNYFQKRIVRVKERGNCLEEVCTVAILLSMIVLPIIKQSGICLKYVLVGISLSPTKVNSSDFLQKETSNASHLSQQTSQVVQVRKSPKKRPLKRYTIVSSSSSTESLSETKGNARIIKKFPSIRAHERK